jgi:hypothetical protein
VVPNVEIGLIANRDPTTVGEPRWRRPEKLDQRGGLGDPSTEFDVCAKDGATAGGWKVSRARALAVVDPERKMASFESGPRN